MDKDTRKLLNALDDQGFDAVQTRRGHWMIYKNGQWITTLAGTGSDHRGIRNAIASLRRAGFDWPR